MQVVSTIYSPLFKLLFFLPDQWVYAGATQNCNLGQANSGETYRSPVKQVRGNFYKGEEAVARGCYKQKVHWRKLGVQSVVAFHWQSWNSLSLAGLLLGEEKFFFPLVGL